MLVHISNLQKFLRGKKIRIKSEFWSTPGASKIKEEEIRIRIQSWAWTICGLILKYKVEKIKIMIHLWTFWMCSFKENCTEDPYLELQEKGAVESWPEIGTREEKLVGFRSTSGTQKRSGKRFKS